MKSLYDVMPKLNVTSSSLSETDAMRNLLPFHMVGLSATRLFHISSIRASSDAGSNFRLWLSERFTFKLCRVIRFSSDGTYIISTSASIVKYLGCNWQNCKCLKWNGNSTSLSRRKRQVNMYNKNNKIVCKRQKWWRCQPHSKTEIESRDVSKIGFKIKTEPDVTC